MSFEVIFLLIFHFIRENSMFYKEYYCTKDPNKQHPFCQNDCLRPPKLNCWETQKQLEFSQSDIDKTLKALNDLRRLAVKGTLKYKFTEQRRHIQKKFVLNIKQAIKMNEIVSNFVLEIDKNEQNNYLNKHPK